MADPLAHSRPLAWPNGFASRRSPVRSRHAPPEEAPETGPFCSRTHTATTRRTGSPMRPETRTASARNRARDEHGRASSLRAPHHGGFRPPASGRHAGSHNREGAVDGDSTSWRDACWRRSRSSPGDGRRPRRARPHAGGDEHGPGRAASSGRGHSRGAAGGRATARPPSRIYRFVPTATRYSFSKRASSAVPRFHSSQNARSASSNSPARPSRSAFARVAIVGP
jgi:hypothetical protein